jgi:hydroxymethylpyrimidine kinase/phosphomethylpyrimidine kinase
VKGSLPIVLTIAGSDNTGGAGIQADIKTCCRFRVYACSVITALTAQNRTGVTSVSYVGYKMLISQLDNTMAMLKPDAVKIGMLPNSEAVEIVAEKLEKYGLSNIVLDPVLGATSGGSLTGKTAETARAMAEYLFPKVTLLTPNIPEAEYFLHLKSGNKTEANEKSVYSDSYAEKLGRELICSNDLRNVLLKGGHLSSEDEVCDRLLSKDANGIVESTDFLGKKIASDHTHGTGCALSSAIACGLACGKSLQDSVKEARLFIEDAIKKGAAYPIAENNGPIYYF